MPRIIASIFGVLFISAANTLGQQLAFPGAEGYGRYTTGGRGGAVLEVTNLNDSGAGSLRAAITAKGARTIVFRVSGTIALQSKLVIAHGDLTIAGQTAPGDGICLKDFPLYLAADNVIIRYLRVRLGDERKLEADAVSGLNCTNLIVDHCSMSWGNDEVASFYDNTNATIQWCLISESLNHSYHHKGDHGYGAIWGGKGATFHHNLLAHHSSRNPRFNGSRTHHDPAKEIVDFRNNVIYNWGENSAYGGEAGNQSLVANYYKYGPGTARRVKNRIVEPYNALGKWYIVDNFVFGFPEITADNWAGGVQGRYAGRGRVDSPLPFAPVATQSAEDAYELVLAKVGAILPSRDALDARIVEEVKTGTARFGGIWGAGTGIIDSQTQVGGWPALRSDVAPVDDDHDGMPNEWEVVHGLDPTRPDDSRGDFNGDGYTNLEKYLQSLESRALATHSAAPDSASRTLRPSHDE